MPGWTAPWSPCEHGGPVSTVDGEARLTSDDFVDPGIFARIFPRPTAREVALAVASAGFSLVQLNLSSFGLPTLPDPGAEPDDRPDYNGIGDAFASEGVAVWGLSATYNMIHPDVTRRRRDTAAAVELIASARSLGAGVVTLCTGTRDPDNMWRAHASNHDPDAWNDMRASLDELLHAAAESGVRLGIEPEAANVVGDARSARRLLDELGAAESLVGIVLDPANLLTTATIDHQERILTEAFGELGPAVVCIHAKDVGGGGFSAPGTGGLDFGLVYRLRQSLPRSVPVIIQDTPEPDASEVRGFLRSLAFVHPWRRDARR
ncbi:MAG: hypothetical protein JWO62_1400 [Acidimicrobiaceae bacterium]|nr:hypothetical protein [Acidimicrobiaceae bacterium]